MKRLLEKRPPPLEKELTTEVKEEDNEEKDLKQKCLGWFEEGIKDIREIFEKENLRKLFQTYVWSHDETFWLPMRILASLSMLALISYDFSIFWGISIFQYSTDIACTFSPNTDPNYPDNVRSLRLKPNFNPSLQSNLIHNNLLEEKK